MSLVESLAQGKRALGRYQSCCYRDGITWTAVQTTRLDQAEHNEIGVFAEYDGDRITRVVQTDGQCHSPTLCSSRNGEIALVWNEFSHGLWRIQCAYLIVDKGRIEYSHAPVVYESENLCLPPAAVYESGFLWITWVSGSEIFRVMIARRDTKDAFFSYAVSDSDRDAFRPTIASDDFGVVLMWDEYPEAEREYRIVATRNDNGSFRRIATVGSSQERWLSPRAVSVPGGVVATWLVLKNVEDNEKGIYDVWTHAKAGRFEGDALFMTIDPERSENQTNVADLREGLLASRVYKSYAGLRRNPQLTVNEKNEVRLCWEMRIEAEKSHTKGHLLTRSLGEDRTWGPARMVHDGGCGYVVSPFHEDKYLPVAFFDFTRIGNDLLICDNIDTARNPSTGPLPVGVEKKWHRWSTVFPITGRDRGVGSQTVDGRYKLYWADTHCHSSFSPDAEGEFDELVRYGRDIANLDVLCIVDNDYYRPKILSDVEWRVENALSRHFSRPGEFLLLPAFEFTYHDSAIDPDHNHRTVIYPFPDGPLFRRIDRNTDTLKKMIEKLRAERAICYPHHCSYDLIDNDVERNVEICSSWRICMEETDFTPARLNNGDKLGFVGSSDNHRAVPGLGGALTGIFAEELSPPAIYDAYLNRRLIATQGARIYVDFRIDGHFIGSSLELDNAAEIAAYISAPSEIEYVEIVRDGQSIHRSEPHSLDHRLRFTDSALSSGSHFYFAKVKLFGDPSFSISPAKQDLALHTTDSVYPHNLARARGVFAWSSPIWVTRRTVPTV